jgi:acyl carrier protein
MKTKLPDHAVPVSFVTLEALPLTSPGKLDRRALSRVAENIPSETGDGCAQPTSPIERELTRIWSEVLGRKGIGRHDNFFNLGGHSLLATQVVSRVYKTFQVELPVGTLFETATLSDLAAAIEAAAKQCGGPSSPAIRPRPRQLQRLDFS